MVKSTAVGSAQESALPDPAAGWSKGLKVATGGRGVVAHAGVVLPRLLVDRIGLTAGLGLGARLRRPRARQGHPVRQPCDAGGTPSEAAATPVRTGC